MVPEQVGVANVRLQYVLDGHPEPGPRPTVAALDGRRNRAPRQSRLEARLLRSVMRSPLWRGTRNSHL
jgi:hypothetical protein